jgi:hypothetical protein
MKSVNLKVVLLLIVMPLISHGSGGNDLYSQDYEEFWKYWGQLKSTALQCSYPNEMAKFLTLAVEMLGNAEVTEANAEEVENQLLLNASCVLNGLSILPDENMNKAVGVFLANPTFIESATLKDALYKAWVGNVYSKVRAAYEKHAKNR